MRDVDGSVAQNYCPRAGYVSCRKASRRYVYQTRCKSWRCKPCKKAKVAVMSERIRQACKLATAPYFVSVTYGIPEKWTTLTKVPEKYASTVAAGATKDWKEFCRRFQRLHNVKLKWLRIPELTKKGMLHWHLIIDGMPSTKEGHRCATKMGVAFLRDEQCGCLTHLISRVWKDVTTWYVVDCRPVTSSNGMGSYLGGYLTKMTEEHYEWLSANGVTRRIDTSRGFGRLPKLLRPVGIGGYDRIDFVHGKPSPSQLKDTRERPEAQPKGGLWSKAQKKEMHRRRLESYANENG